MSRCLVTGGLGFIGSHIVDRLRADGHEVVVVDDLSANVTQPNSQTIVSDFTETPGSVLAECDFIFHLAAVSRTPPAVSDPLRCHLVNADGTLCLLEKVRNHAPKARVVLASSNVVLGNWTAYKVSKLCCEHYAEVYNHLYGGNIIALRFANVYGPGMRWNDLACFASLRRSMVEHGFLGITGDGTQSRDWVHVSDIVEGCVLAAKSNYKGVLDLCSGRNVSMNEVASFFSCPVRYLSPRAGDIEHIFQSPTKAKDELNWAAKVQLEEGIFDVINERN